MRHLPRLGDDGSYPFTTMHTVKYIPLTLMLLFLTSCTPQTSGTYDATHKKQLDDYDRQTATTERQLDQTQKQLNQTQQQQDETERQLQRAKSHADRYEALLDRWEKQADRQDKMLDAVELLLLNQKDDDNSSKP
jgi:septal ring factor EnvC (AmiA/AmiB activator)